MNPLLIGSLEDTHLRVVHDQLITLGVEPVVVDADSIGPSGYALGVDSLQIDDTILEEGGKGWLRRIAANRWTSGEVVGSVPDVTFRARVQLIASITRSHRRQWLTSLDALQAAEDRIYQLTVAAQLGITTPMSLVSSDPALIAGALGEDIIIKPIASGAFVSSDLQPHAVHTKHLTTEILEQGDFAGAPFIAQQRINVAKHLRVVTAGPVVRSASLNAADWPLDWRTADQAHAAWVPDTQHIEIEHDALRLATTLKVGYSSQDWLLPNDGGEPVFIDLNPAGQWMFLPADVANPITEQIVNYLASP